MHRRGLSVLLRPTNYLQLDTAAANTEYFLVLMSVKVGLTEAEVTESVCVSRTILYLVTAAVVVLKQ
jgi:hypothetical protein